MNIAIVFILSGLWHGADLSFVAWGAMHAIYRIVDDRKIKIDKNYKKIGNIIKTFLLVDFAWIFFVADSLKHAARIIYQMIKNLFVFTKFRYMEYGLGNWVLIVCGIFVVLFIDLLHEKECSVLVWLESKNIVIRWTIYMTLIWSILLFGIYGATYDTSQFIYFQF